MRFLRLAIAIGMAAGLTAALAGQVVACVCSGGTTDQAMEAADVAFSGTAVRAAPAPPVLNPESITMFVFAVDGVAKGAIGPEVAVAAFDGTSCGSSFGIGERWLIFAGREGPTLETDPCSGNVALAPGEPPPVPVVPPSGPATSPDSGFVVPVPLLIATGALTLLAAVSAWAFSRRREL